MNRLNEVELPMNPKQAIAAVKANVSYQFLREADELGIQVPMELGQGKFAKVFKGKQRSAGRDVRFVAIKVLHDYATIAHESLFRQELELLKEMTVDVGTNVVNTLDVLQLKPMVMCGCGLVYQPACPGGCNVLLSRKENNRDQYPALSCERCGYELSARFVNQRFGELLKHPAKPCCRQGTTAESGRILNFVDREAVVMELLEDSLSDLVGRRPEELRKRFTPFLRRKAAPSATGGGVQTGSGGMYAPANGHGANGHGANGHGANGHSANGNGGRVIANGHVQTTGEQVYPNGFSPGHSSESLLDRIGRWLREPLWGEDRGEELLRRIVLLEKVRIMLELAESVAWLHGHKRIVHKDLAPDNVMIGRNGVESSGPAAFLDTLHEVVARPRFHIRVIDFGLSDKNELTRSWYEDEVPMGSIKRPFLSPEAQLNHVRINQSIEFLDGSRFRVPSAVERDLMQSDILADMRDSEHNHDLDIKRIVRDPAGGGLIAHFTGDASSNTRNQQFEIVHRLGEAHDLYAVGALCYYILTENLDDVMQLNSFVMSLDDLRLPLVPQALSQNAQYMRRRDAIRERLWQDELMVLILRAMVRGTSNSLCPSRIYRGPEASQILLRETRRIYHGIQKEVLTRV